MRYRFLTLLIVMFALASCAKDIVVLTGDIKGVVKDKDTGSLISNCEVSIMPGGDTLITGDNGSWGFAGLNPGEYTLTFKKAGYDDTSCNVTVVTGKTTERDILLQPKGPFALSDTAYNFGDYTMTKTFTCFNNSDTDSTYEINNLPAWLTCNKQGGVVEAGSTDTFTLSVSREGLSEGEYNHNVIIGYSGRQDGEVTLRVRVERVMPKAPQLEIAPAATGVGKDCFTIEASVTAMGGSQITAYGFYWGKSESSMSDKNNLGVMSEMSSFKGTITNLEYNTTYYVKAYATNATGTGYSDVVAVTTQDIGSDKWDGSTAKSFAGGKGTSASPYLIETGAQLVLMKQYSSSCFKLMQNINLNNRAWPSFDFSGTLDGNGFVISNLKVTKSDDNVGLFAILKGTVNNLTISGVNIDSSGDNVGAIAGQLSKGSITNCTIQLNNSSLISGNNMIGGVVGIANGDFSMVAKCSVNGVSTTNQIVGNNYVGGIVGYFHHYATPSPMEDCSVSANIAGTDIVGGLIGYSSIGGSVGDDGFYIKKSSFVGELSANSNVAGIVGYCTSNTIIAGCKADVKINVEDDYAAGIASSSSTIYSSDIIGSYVVGEIVCSKGNANAVGGLVATMYGTDCAIDNCYSMVLCNSTNFSGLCGCEGSGSHWNCYYSGIINCASIMPEVHNVDYCTSTSNNFSEFLQSCYSAYASYWDFDNTWTWTGKVNGQSRSVICPRLTWED